MNRVLVTLTEPELEAACNAGVRRRISAMKQGRRSTHPETPDWKQAWWQSDIIGAIGEFAVAKAFDVEWDPTIGRVDRPDVLDYEVRTTELPEPKLRVRAHNDLTKRYILCSYKLNKVLIQGWQIGTNVKKQGREEYDGVWIAGVDELYSIVDLGPDIVLGDGVELYHPTQGR